MKLNQSEKIKALKTYLLDLDSIGGLHSNALSGYTPSSNKQKSLTVNTKSSIGSGINTSENALILHLDDIRASRVARAAFLRLSKDEREVIGLVISHDLVKLPVVFLNKSILYLENKEKFFLAGVICYLSNRVFKKNLVGINNKLQLNINFSKEEFEVLYKEAKIKFIQALSNYLIQCDLVEL